MTVRMLLPTLLLGLSATVAGVPADCVDNDGDGYGAFGDPSCPNGPAVDCDDANDAVFPGAPEVCDGVNNDCADPSWPDTIHWVYRFIGNPDEAVFPADLDGDADLDVLTVYSYEEGDVRWYENVAGDGSDWDNNLISYYYSYPHSAFAADLDGDGDMDALTGGEDQSLISWWENTAGDGSDWDWHNISHGEGKVWVFAADLDGDDDVDVLVASELEDKIAWYENTAGNGQIWSAHVISTSADDAMSVFVADVDGDDDVDVLSASMADDKIAWYENTAGDGSAWSEHVISTSADQARSVFAADVDGDDDVDVLSASMADDKIAWYENTAGDGSAWSEQVISTSADSARSVFAADLDFDGDVDALSASYQDDKIAWYENTAGDGSAWTERVISTTANGAASVFAADMDGNGDLDVLGASLSIDSLALYVQVRFEGDLDGDGTAICEGDCNDTNPNCDVDCTDADRDGYCVTTDCDEANPHCEADCTDLDLDGHCVTTDCDDVVRDLRRRGQ